MWRKKKGESKENNLCILHFTHSMQHSTETTDKAYSSIFHFISHSITQRITSPHSALLFN